MISRFYWAISFTTASTQIISSEGSILRVWLDGLNLEGLKVPGASRMRIQQATRNRSHVRVAFWIMVSQDYPPLETMHHRRPGHYLTGK